MARVYAQDTTVPAERSQSEIRAMLKDIGAGRYAALEYGDTVEIAFEVEGIAYRISRPPLPEIAGKSSEQREKAAWRALVLLVKAKSVAVKQGITTVEREFFADTVIPGGDRLIDHHEKLIGHAYKDGPPQLGYMP